MEGFWVCVNNNCPCTNAPRNTFSAEVFINEVDNEPATKAVDVVLTYLKKNPSYGLSVQIESIEANKTDAKILLEASKYGFKTKGIISYHLDSIS